MKRFTTLLKVLAKAITIYLIHPVNQKQKIFVRIPHFLHIQFDVEENSCSSRLTSISIPPSRKHLFLITVNKNFQPLSFN